MSILHKYSRNFKNIREFVAIAYIQMYYIQNIYTIYIHIYVLKLNNSK